MNRQMIDLYMIRQLFFTSHNLNAVSPYAFCRNAGSMAKICTLLTYKEYFISLCTPLSYLE